MAGDACACTDFCASKLKTGGYAECHLRPLQLLLHGMRLLLRPYFEETYSVRLKTIQDYFWALSWAPM